MSNDHEHEHGRRDLAGAALPKAAHELSRKGSQRRVECFSCGARYHASRAEVRRGTHHCRCGAGAMIPSHPEDCLELTPELADRHPVLIRAHELELAAELRGVDRSAQDRRWSAGGRDPNACGGCSYTRPAGADPDHWLCPKCGDVNDHGTSSHALPFGVEAERARGLVVRPASLERPAPAQLPETRAELAARLANERLADDLPF